MKKRISILLVLAMLLALAACSTPEAPATEATEPPTTEAPTTEATEPETEPLSPNLIGISMPAEESLRWHWDDWKQDGFNMKYQLEELGYEVDLQFADNDISTQRSQVENMIVNGCKVLVIASLDGTVLEQAKEAGIPVIAYKWLDVFSDAVTYYINFGSWDVGVKQAEFIVDTLDLENAGDKTFNIEFLAGDPGSSAIHFFFDSAMRVLQPYVDAGTLVIRSGQNTTYDCATPGWATDKAQERFENILATYYADGTPLHAVLAPTDSTAQGVANALAANYDNEIYPIITGQDCDIVSVQNIIAGKQAMSVFQDHRDLAAKAVEMVNAILNGAKPPINDTESYDMPSYWVESRVVTAENVREYLIDPGYYSAADLGL